MLISLLVDKELMGKEILVVLLLQAVHGEAVAEAELVQLEATVKEMETAE